MVEKSRVQMALEDDMRNVAWDIVGHLTVSELLADCVEALVEAYKQDDELYHLDKEATQSDDVENPTKPFTNYINSLEQDEDDADDTAE